MGRKEGTNISGAAEEDSVRTLQSGSAVRVHKSVSSGKGNVAERMCHQTKEKLRR